LFTGVDPIGEQVTVGGALFTVVGVLAAKSSTGFQDPNDTAVAPLTAVRQVLTGYGALSSILVEAAGPDRVNAVQNEVSAILDRRLGVTAASSGGGGTAGTPYRIQNASQLLATQTETADTFTTVRTAKAGSVKNIKAGDTVTVQGGAAADGTVTATELTATAAK
jgi:putative ABC transport system permease protein